MDSTAAVALVTAAQAGDRRALARLLSEHLPLVYNVVGAALAGHSDVDDVVQETMLRAVQRLGDLREPERFRAWLLAIAIRQVQDRGRARAAAAARHRPLDDTGQLEDPGAEFVDATIARMTVAAERREAAQAIRWLGVEERQLLSLWGQEVAGSLSRADLAAALRVSQPHAAVRVQRMKARLDLARAVLRAWRATPRCAQLTLAGQGWGERLDPLWLKRLGRHVRECAACTAAAQRLIPTEQLLVGAALTPPALLTAGILDLATKAAAPVSHALARVLGAVSAKSAVLAGSVAAGAAAVVLAVYTTSTPPPVAPLAGPTVSAPATLPPFSPTPGATTAPATTTAALAPLADLVVAPDGRDDNPGTLAQPLATLNRAVALVAPGQTIALRGGTYQAAAPVTISTSGTAEKRITLSNYGTERAIIDASKIRSNQWYVTQKASYWTVQGLEIVHAPTYAYVCVSCQHNVFQRLSIHDNGNTGFFLRGDGTVDNQIVNSDFFGNHDDASHGENADGVAVMYGSGTGNVIRGCRLFDNSDDGLDLGSFTDPVTISHTWSYGNGVNRWNIADFTGDGMGFKLGGGSPAPNANHVVNDSAAWDNASYGFSENSNHGGLMVSQDTAFRNGKDGFAFWYSTATLTHDLALSNSRDTNRGSATTEKDNSWNQSGWSVNSLRSTDPATAQGPRRPDGSLPETDFLRPAQPGVGATMGPD